MNLALYTCVAQYPIEPLFTSTDELAVWIGALYEFYRDTAIPCLEAQGIAAPTLPSETTFATTIGTADEYLPLPADISQSEYERAVAECEVDFTLSYADLTSKEG